LIGAKYAEMQGKGDVYQMAVFRAYWQQAQAIDDPQVLARLAKDVGLDTGPFLAALDDRWLEAEVLADEGEAYTRGITGVPVMVFLRKYLVKGAQPYSVLKDLIERIEAGGVT
jgi:predicted DsbA family dithiol-disulfide isomerase